MSDLTVCWALQIDDQGLVNTDPRYIAVPNTWVNLIPTDIRGLTFSRTPQMVSTPPTRLIHHVTQLKLMPSSFGCYLRSLQFELLSCSQVHVYALVHQHPDAKQIE